MGTTIFLIVSVCVIITIFSIILMIRDFTVRKFYDNVNDQAFRVVMSFLNSIANEEYTTEHHDKHLEILDMSFLYAKYLYKINNILYCIKDIKIYFLLFQNKKYIHILLSGNKNNYLYYLKYNHS